MSKLNKKNYFDLTIFFILGILVRFPFLEKMQSHWDGPQYSIGIARYSLENHTPAPPGYPIYIGFGKLAHLFNSDIHQSILMVSLIAGGIGTAFFYFLGLKFFNRSVGFITALLFLTGPTFFYFAITANPYGILPITAGMLALIVFQIKKGGNHGFILGITYAISIGIRPQDGIFITPLFLYGLFLCDRKNKIYSLISFTLGLLVWILPLFSATEGPKNYFYLLKKYQETALTNASIAHLFNVWFILVKGLFLSFTFANLFLLLYFFDFVNFLKIKNKISFILKNDYIIIFSLWILPSLLFNAFIRSDHAAHQMTYLSAFLVLISYSIWRIFKSNTTLLWITVYFLMMFNLFTLFRDRDPRMIKPYIPQSYHYSEIQKNDIRMKNKVNYILKSYNPNKVIIITTEEMFRPYSYYLKNYKIIAINALQSRDFPYSNDISTGENWNLTQINSKGREFALPLNIETIIFLDENANIWLKNKNIKTIKFPANSSITEISRKNFMNLKYDYHYLELE